MKKHDFGKPLCRLVMAVAMMMLSLQAMAYDFYYTYQGKTLYYNRTSDNTVEVTYYSSTSSNYVSGDVVIPNSVEYNGATYSVTSIGGYAFSYCRGLTSITIPNSVTSIGGYAFWGCSGLTSVTIGNSVTSIGAWAFYACSGLTSVTIGNSVTSIGGLAFSGCSGLTSVSIPNSVTSIGVWAFGNCSRLTSVSIPNSVTSIGESAFIDCFSLTSVTIPNSVTSIGEQAFSGCSGLTSVTIPNSVTSIGARAFWNCSRLTTLNFNAINCQDLEGIRYYSSSTHTTYYYYPFSGTSLTTVNIGDSVQRIPANFVRDFSDLTSVSIPNSVTYIGGWAFKGCSGLTSITIPTGVTSIGDNAFAYCSGLTTLNFNAINCQNFDRNGNYYYPFRGTSLTTVNIGDSVQRIPAKFVRGCSGLTSITIPNSVTSIGDEAFSYCSGLTTLNFNAINCQDYQSYYGDSPFSGTSLTTVNIGDSVQRIPANFVRDCSGLTSVNIGTGVTSIGESAFSGCSGLTSVTIPNSVTSIGDTAFRGCSGLTSVTIGNSLTSIGYRAFYECLNLSSLISSATVPPTIGNEAFPYPNICTVTVPCGSLAAYTASTCYWSVYFPQRITAGFPFELNISANDSTLGTVVITTGESCAEGVLTAIPELCYRFVAWNDGNTTNPRTITLTQDTTLTANFERAVYTQEIHHAICEGSVYTENGFNVSEAGTYTQNLQTVNGCDSIVTLTLTVNPVANTNLTAAICEGSTYTENGFNVSEAGTYTQNLQTVNGCDSIVTLTLSVNPVANTTLSVTICDGTTYTENGFNVSEAGTYTQNLQTVNGCDRIVTLTLTVNPTYNITIDASINEGEMYEENGFSESEAGTYVHTLQSEFGCDSVITLNLTVNSSLNDVVANAVEIRLYPNPARAYTMLKVEDLKEQTIVYLFDIQGRKLKEYVLNAAQQTLRIDASDLPKGVYTIMIGNTTRKLIVE